MKLFEFRVQMFHCIADSGWVRIENLTVMVGKNESGKTSLLRALQLLNPANGEKYDIARDWPRGLRSQRSVKHPVCSARFSLSEQEQIMVKKICGLEFQTVEVNRDYEGTLHFAVPNAVPRSLESATVMDVLKAIVPDPGDADPEIASIVRDLHEEFLRLAVQPGKTSVDVAHEAAKKLLKKRRDASSRKDAVNGIFGALSSAAAKLKRATRTTSEIHNYLEKHLPPFVYMDEYQIFRGRALLHQVRERQETKLLEADDNTFLSILKLAGLDLDRLASAIEPDELMERQLDLEDASKRITKAIASHWRTGSYEVRFVVDGNQFLTMIKDADRPTLTRLEERSKGFQWFFSFDAMLMSDIEGHFKDSVILLDEPGLHLHPSAQGDLLDRLEDYATENTVIYSTHLPFMIDLRKPERIRVLSDSAAGSVVAYELTTTSPESKLTLQAALGMSARSSYLVAEQNLVVEGVDDYWIISELSNLLARSGKIALNDGVLITPSGGASEATYIATFMIGQGLDVVVLYDSDPAGKTAHDKLVKNWLAHYKERKAGTLMLAKAVKSGASEFAIEDVFDETFYIRHVLEAYANKLPSGVDAIVALPPGLQLSKRVEAWLAGFQLNLNKGSIAKRICATLRRMKDLTELSAETASKAETLVKSINAAFPT